MFVATLIFVHFWEEPLSPSRLTIYLPGQLEITESGNGNGNGNGNGKLEKVVRWKHRSLLASVSQIHADSYSSMKPLCLTLEDPYTCKTVPLSE